MTKFIAVVNVIAWSGFWAFGYIAVTSRDMTDGRLAVAAALALLGLIVGSFAWRSLCRAAEERGYARARRQLDPETRARAQAEWDN